jgi:peptidoglycan/LPS O-acetylase OafA/YrhL
VAATGERALGHVPALDGVRGVAVLLVVGLHLGFLLRPSFGGLFPGGFLGVDLFFVLSGFLITSLLVAERARTGRIDLPRFYLRRAYRLLPALVALLAAHALWSGYVDIPLATEVKAQLSVLLYASNFVQSAGFDMPRELVHTWTLSVEEQFYLVWPALILLLVSRIRSRQVIAGLIVAGIVASALVRLWIWRYGSGYPAAYMRIDARADGLLVGALCAFAWRWRVVPAPVAKVAGTAGLVGLGLLALLWDPRSESMFEGGYTLVALAGGAVILAALTEDWAPLPAFDWAPLRAVGRVSYGLYLWHVPCIYAVEREMGGQPGLVQAIVALALSALATFLSWRFVEQPFLRRKARMRPVALQPASSTPPA